MAYKQNDKANYQPWVEEAFQADPWVRRVATPRQRDMYGNLLRAAWVVSTRPFLPDDDSQLWVLANCEGPEEWAQNRDAVLSQFSRREDGLLEHPRVTRDWQALLDVREERAEAGRKGGHAKLGYRKANSSAIPEGSGAILKNSKNSKSESESSQSERERESQVKSTDGLTDLTDKGKKAHPPASLSTDSTDRPTDSAGRGEREALFRKIMEALPDLNEEAVSFALRARWGKWCLEADKPVAYFRKCLPEVMEAWEKHLRNRPAPGPAQPVRATPSLSWSKDDLLEDIEWLGGRPPAQRVPMP